MSLSIAFVDATYPRPYIHADMGSVPLGGTETSLLKVASELGEHNIVTLFQKNRLVEENDQRLNYENLKVLFKGKPCVDQIVVINSWKVACRLRKIYPDTPILVWLHVYPGKHHKQMGYMLHKADIPVFGVSRTHAATLRKLFSTEHHAFPKVDYVYNPVADDLMPNNTPRDPDRLLYASSPHKGLAQVFEQFREVRKTVPSLYLRVADPGYLKWPVGHIPAGVEFIGRLSQRELADEMRRALCLFYPQTGFAETFGLVIAECMAVGTPVLVHRDLGANEEVVGQSDWLIDGTDVETIQDRLFQLRKNFPSVRVNPAFRTSAVVKKWNAVLNGNEGQHSANSMKRVSA